MTRQDFLRESHHPYADPAYYDHDYGGASLPDDLKLALLVRASTNIDILTFGRIQAIIKRIGWDEGLSERQQYLIREATCKQAEFIHEHADMVDTVMDSYSINGVSMHFGGPGMHVENGVMMSQETYELLKQTGLTVRLI